MIRREDVHARPSVSGPGTASRGRRERTDARAGRVPSDAERRIRAAERPSRARKPTGVATVLFGAVLLLAGAAAALPGAGARPGGATPPAAPMSGLPPALREVGFDQNLGAELPLDLRFRDESGAAVALGRYFDGRPVLLSLVYYECPMLCTLALNGLVRSLRVLDLDPGRDFEVVTLSFAARETSDLAAAKKANYVGELGKPGAAAAWHFLTGDSTAIAALVRSVGFRFAYDAETGQYAHATGVVLLTPGGRIARYLYGVEYAPRDLRLGLVEASEGRIGGVVDQALLYCFQYDPERGTYAAATLRIVRAGGILTVVGTAAMVLLLRRRERRRPGMAAPPAARTA